MNGMCKTLLEDESLKTTFHEVLNFETKDVIESLMLLIKDTETRETTDDSFTFENTAFILRI